MSKQTPGIYPGGSTLLSSAPLVSVVINNYNYGKYLGQAIDSCLGQSYRDIEIVVVDDGSTDDSVAIIKGYGTKIVPVLKPNGGQSSAFNAGFVASKGDIICFLDSDDWFFPDKILTVVEDFVSNPKVEWIFHAQKLTFPGGATRIVPTYPQDAFVDARREIMETGELKYTAPATSGLSFRRALLSRILPMSEEIRIGSDNYLKFASASTSAGLLLKEPLSWQRIHDNNAWSLRTDKQLMKARLHLLIARELQTKVPVATRFADKIFAMAVAAYARCGERDPVSRDAIRSYLKQCSIKDLGVIVPRVAYHLVRSLRSNPYDVKLSAASEE
jgi:glycosyltransferase involved in cell wall biosynthesis